MARRLNHFRQEIPRLAGEGCGLVNSHTSVVAKTRTRICAQKCFTVEHLVFPRGTKMHDDIRLQFGNKLGPVGSGHYDPDFESIYTLSKIPRDYIRSNGIQGRAKFVSQPHASSGGY